MVKDLKIFLMTLHDKGIVFLPGQAYQVLTHRICRIYRKKRTLRRRHLFYFIWRRQSITLPSSPRCGSIMLQVDSHAPAHAPWPDPWWLHWWMRHNRRTEVPLPYVHQYSHLTYALI